MKNIIVAYKQFIHLSQKVCPFSHLQCLTQETIKPKLFNLLLVKAYLKGKQIPTYNTNSQRQRTSNMLSNVFRCFMLISLPKKQERLTKTLPEIKVELKC